MTRHALLEILDLARWAPSGDNTQPWRFEIVADDRVVVHGFDTRERCVYDLDGHSSQIALGAMLETLAIAASAKGLSAHAQRRTGCADTEPMFDVMLAADPEATSSDLVPAIKLRSVQRRPLSTRPLVDTEKARLAGSVGPDFVLCWLEGWRARLRTTRALVFNSKIRLTMPEAYQVHRDIIAWNADFSEDKVPDRAVGLDPVSTMLMRWVMRDWRRVQFFNTFLAGTIVPRVQLDLIPGLACAAHVLVVASKEPSGIDDYVAAGRAVQRFWLTAALLGLQHQPEVTPLIFSRYIREARSFSARTRTMIDAKRLRGEIGALVGSDVADRAVWMGRIGAGKPARARSLRLPLEKLIVSGTRSI
jgi:hypothetical protein